MTRRQSEKAAQLKRRWSLMSTEGPSRAEPQIGAPRAPSFLGHPMADFPGEAPLQPDPPTASKGSFWRGPGARLSRAHLRCRAHLLPVLTGLLRGCEPSLWSSPTPHQPSWRLQAPHTASRFLEPSAPSPPSPSLRVAPAVSPPGNAAPPGLQQRAPLCGSLLSLHLLTLEVPQQLSTLPPHRPPGPLL